MHSSIYRLNIANSVPSAAQISGLFSIRVNNNVEIPLPPKVSLEDIQRLPLPVQKLILRGTPRDDIDRERLQWQYRSYYGSVAMLDREIGAIVDALERSGKAANTVVIFSTDHGDQMLEHGLEGKNVFFEASVQVPFMISWPGVIRPSTG